MATEVNDVHSRLNPTTVARVVSPRSVTGLATAVRRAAEAGLNVSVAGGRHAMGGQQFGAGTLLIDTTALRRVLHVDSSRGLVEAEAGIHWPTLITALRRAQSGQERQWGIAQKQTGADRLSLGGSLSANGHGRGLTMTPLVGDVESLTLIDASGTSRTVSRTAHPALFALAIGGYGLAGIIATVTLRLRPRTKLRRVVELIDVDDVMAAFDRRIAAGYLYGDCQFAIDPAHPDFLRRAIFSTYEPVDTTTPVPRSQHSLSNDDWMRLLLLAHSRKTEAFDAYCAHYVRTSGQLYWSDTHQLTEYLDGYHATIDAELGAAHPASEVITELYVPRHRLSDFMADVRADFRRHAVDVIYGTIRLIEADRETFLPWARDRYACVIFNLHTEHTPDGQTRSAEAFRRLIDLAIDRGGSYFLTYHRHARRDQVDACYPRFAEFLRLKRVYDPDDRLQSDWYRHYQRLYGLA